MPSGQERRKHARSAQKPGTVSRHAQRRVSRRVRQIIARRRSVEQAGLSPSADRRRTTAEVRRAIRAHETRFKARPVRFSIAAHAIERIASWYARGVAEPARSARCRPGSAPAERVLEQHDDEVAIDCRGVPAEPPASFSAFFASGRDRVVRSGPPTAPAKRLRAEHRRPTPNGDLHGQFRPQRRRAVSRSRRSVAPCANDISHVCAVPVVHRWLARRTPAGSAASSGRPRVDRETRCG